MPAKILFTGSVGVARRSSQDYDDRLQAWWNHIRGSKCGLCGSARVVEREAMGGLSVRRDCLKCRRFVGWVIWRVNSNGNSDEAASMSRRPALA